MADNHLSVKTYSGRTYAERPVSFVWRGTQFTVASIDKTWLEPGQRHFSVRTLDSRRFHLWYDETHDCWQITARQ